MCSRLLLSAVFAVSACSAEDPGPPDTPDPTDELVTLVEGDWTMPSGQEGYYCALATIAEDLYIREFHPIAPPGTHHTALSVVSTTDPDGAYPCSAESIGFELLFGSGVGTDPFVLPDGVAFKLAAGTRVLLNLHLYNTTDGPMDGTSGVEVRLARSEEVLHEAETVYVIGFDLQVPPGESVHEVDCTMGSDVTIFGVFPHMHQLGTRMQAIALPSGEDPIVLHDEAFDFEEQLNHLVEPVSLAAGDRVRAACSFDNPTSQTIGFGDSSDQEMCVLGLYRYPATGSFGLCFN
jgi:hypothetical protein